MLVNASALGMTRPCRRFRCALDPLPERCGRRIDIVYAPLETPLLAAARARGLRTVDGLAMLIGQAAPAFELFFGAAPPREHDDELRELLTSMTVILGLTGSIGMGKSTVARMFADAGVPVFDADAAVHRLQGPDGALVAAIEAAFPGTTGAGGVDRTALAEAVLGRARGICAGWRPDPSRGGGASARRSSPRHADAPLVVLDIPLAVREGRLDAQCRQDRGGLRRRRGPARARAGAARHDRGEVRAASSPARCPMPEKRARADFVIPTDGSLDETRAAVASIIACLAERADS